MSSGSRGPQPLQVRWQQFRGFSDTGWRPLRPLTLLIGPNHSGKTSFLAPLLALKQTLASPDRLVQLKLRGELTDLGTFTDACFRHDASAGIKLGIRFHYHKETDSELEPVGAYSPGELRLAFGSSDDGGASLVRYSIDDHYGRPYVTRNLWKTERYGLTGSPVKTADRPSLSTNAADAAARSYIKEEQPQHFLFDGNAAMSAAMDYQHNQHHHEDADEMIRELDLSPEVLQYARSTSYTSSQIRAIFSKLQYVGPLRSRPKRIYELSDEQPRHVGSRGSDAPDMLFRADDELRSRIDKIFSCLGVPVEFEIARYPRERAFSIMLTGPSGNSVNLADAGFGFSQLLPLVIQLAAAKPHTHVLIEQPEIHLNPAFHGHFADVAIDRASDGVRIVMETHSEHILLRVRRRIAEGTLDPDLLALYYFTQSPAGSSIREISVDGRGLISGDQWPEGFFGEDIEDAVALMTAATSK